MDRQKLIDKMLTLYAYRVDRDKDGLVHSAFQCMFDLTQDDGCKKHACQIRYGECNKFENAMCAIGLRAKGILDIENNYVDDWKQISPETEKVFTYCRECKAFGRMAHTLACSKLKEVEHG